MEDPQNPEDVNRDHMTDDDMIWKEDGSARVKFREWRGIVLFDSC